MSNPARALQSESDKPAKVTKLNLTAEDAAAIDAHFTAIHAASKRVVADVIEMGRRFTEIKKRAGHRNWLPLLEREHIEERFAQLNMRVYELAQAKSENFADLSIPVSSLYLLAAKSTPPAAVTRVIELAQAGEEVKHGDVKAIIADVKEAKAEASVSRETSKPDNSITAPKPGHAVVGQPKGASKTS